MLGIKIVSATGIFLSSTIIGYLYSRRYYLRYINLIYLEQCIRILESEIIYGANPLPEALDNVYLKGNERVSFIFKDIRMDLLNSKRGDIYYSFLGVKEDLINKLHFTKEDVEMFLSLGKVLGNSSREDQGKNFALIFNQIQALILNAREERQVYEKMFRSLGLLMGIAIIIILI